MFGEASQLARQPAGWRANQPVDLPARRQPAATAQNLNFSLKSLKSVKKSMFSRENRCVLKPWAQNTNVFTAKPGFFPTFPTFSRKLKPRKIIENGKTPVFSQLNLVFFRFFRLFRLFGKRFCCWEEPASWPGRQPAGQPTSQSTSQPTASQQHRLNPFLHLSCWEGNAHVRRCHTPSRGGGGHPLSTRRSGWASHKCGGGGHPVSKKNTVHYGIG